MNKVCFFNSTPFWGGGEKLHLEYALYFKQVGVDVILACKPKSPLHKKAQEAGLSTLSVTAGNLSFLNPFAVHKVAKALKTHGVDTVIATTSEDIKICAFASKKANISRVVYLRGLAVPIKNSIVNRLIFSKYLTHIVANSEETKRQMFTHISENNIGAKVGVIYHGIDTSISLTTQQVYPLPHKKPNTVILGNAGRLTKQKGQDLLIAVAKILKDRNVDFQLYIAGDGALKEDLEATIKSHNLTNHVFLLGFVAEMNAFMNAIDVFLLSSAWEGFGFVLVEAMLTGCPVVAFNKSSNPEIVSDQETGFLVTYPDVDAFADKVEMLIKDEALRKTLGEKGKQRVRSHFDKQQRIKDFLNFIAS